MYGPAGVKEMPPKGVRITSQSNAKRFAPAPNYKCADSLSIRLCSFLERLAGPFLKKKKWALFEFRFLGNWLFYLVTYSFLFCSECVISFIVINLKSAEIHGQSLLATSK